MLFWVAADHFQTKNQFPLDTNNNVFFFKTRIVVALFSQIPSMFRLTNGGIGNLWKWYNSVKAIPEKRTHNGFTYAFKEVNFKVCADLKCKFLSEILYL